MQTHLLSQKEPCLIHLRNGKSEGTETVLLFGPDTVTNLDTVNKPLDPRPDTGHGM